MTKHSVGINFINPILSLDWREKNGISNLKNDKWIELTILWNKFICFLQIFSSPFWNRFAGAEKDETCYQE